MRIPRFYQAVLSAVLLLLVTAAHAGQVTLWEHEKSEEQKVLDELIKRFEAQNKGITVKRSHYKTEDLRPQFQTAALAGGGADIVIAPNDFAGPFSVMGIIKPVQTFANLELFFPSVVKAVTDNSGAVWGYPISNGNHLMLFVNKKLVPEAPKTIEALVSSAKKATKADKKIYGFAYNLTEPFWFVTFLSAYGERPLEKSQPKLGSQAMVDALTLVSDMKFKDKIVPGDCDYACADTLFSEGKAGMIINGDWAIQKYQSDLKKDLIIAPLPKFEKTGIFMQPMVSGKYVFFNKRLKGAKLEDAKKFAEFLATTPSQELIAKEVGRLPAAKAAAESPAIKQDATLSASLKAMEHGQPMPMDVEMRAIWDAIRPQLQGVMAGRTEAKLAAQVMQKDAETKIKEMKQ